MIITSILLQFHLQISLIARINPFSGCSHCLEASQVVCDTNQLADFSVVGISFEGSPRAICKIILFVNRILLLLPVLRLALIFLTFMVYLVFFTLYCFSTLVCANLVGNLVSVLWLVVLTQSACSDLGSTFIDTVPWSAQVFLTILLLTGKACVQKDMVLQPSFIITWRC